MQEYQYLQFQLKEVTSPDPILIKITAVYQGQPVAEVTLDQEGKTTVTTEAYNESNKKIYNCKLQLQGEEWKSSNTLTTVNFLIFDLHNTFI